MTGTICSVLLRGSLSIFQYKNSKKLTFLIFIKLKDEILNTQEKKSDKDDGDKILEFSQFFGKKVITQKKFMGLFKRNAMMRKI